MERKAKEKLVSELHNIFASSELVVLLRQSGVSVVEASGLRAEAREHAVRYKVTKNSLARLALKGTDYEHLESLFVGPTAITYGQDEVSAAKILVDYMKKVDKFEIIGGAHRANALDASSIKQLASLPSLDELRSKLLGLFQAPATKLARVTKAPSEKLARVFAVYGAKN